MSSLSSFNTTPPPQIYTLSLHDALPISALAIPEQMREGPHRGTALNILNGGFTKERLAVRSEEHTSELQSRFDLVCRLLLEKKKKKENASVVVVVCELMS